MSIAQGKFSASFDLLYLDYTEHLFSNICSFANFENKTSKGKLRVTNNSLIFEDFNMNQPLVKYVYDDQFSIKTLSCEEIKITCQYCCSQNIQLLIICHMLSFIK